MWKSTLLLIFFSGYCLGGPLGLKNMPIIQQKETAATKATYTEIETGSAETTAPDMMIISTLNLPSNATSIRADITDGFSCRNRTYGYYADVDNDCQIFHVCLPVTYADGKESTFRWSFICPEETVFSQDSFTCMRPEDMVITCEESFKYYELNRNFGIVENELEHDIENESINFAQSQQPFVTSAKPEPKPEEEAILMIEEESKPINLPVKVQKPNRRKPGSSFIAQKRPNSPSQYPLRKLPPVQGVTSDAVPEADTAKLQEGELVKSSIQKFSRRPLPSTTLKDKTPTFHSESITALRTELYNQKRKRPTLFNKHDTVLSTDTDNAPISQPSRIENPIQTFSKVESELSDVNAQAEMADSDSQASENKETFIKPVFIGSSPASNDILMVDEPQIIEHEINSEETNETPSEAIENIPVFIEESEDTKLTEDLESVKTEQENSESIQASETTQTLNENYSPEEPLNLDLSQPASAEETEHLGDHISELIRPASDTRIKDSILPVENQPVLDIQPVEDIQFPEESHTAIEASAVHENTLKTIKESSASAQIEANVNSPILSENEPIVGNLPAIAEETQPLGDAQTIEEIPLLQKEDGIEENKLPTQVFEESEILEENSEESSPPVQSQTVEEMEAEKPDEAPESMPATQEMTQQDPLVQQMFEEKMDTSKQSIGGFKPADPVMAAEAEKLIVDFINTLRKTDTDNKEESESVQMEDEISQDLKSQEDEPEVEIKKVIEDEAENLEEQESVNTSQDLDKSIETESVQEIIESESPVEMSIENDIPSNESEVSEELNLKSESDAHEEIMNESDESTALKSLEGQHFETAYYTESEQGDPQQSLIDNHIEQEIQDILTDEDSSVAEIEENRENEALSAISSENAEDTVAEIDETATPFTNGYKPLSIDDIVELVKERLDHMPKKEMEVPMQLDQVLNDVNEEESHGRNSEEQKENVEIQSGEDIVMPIYHRVPNDQTVAQIAGSESINKMEHADQNDNEPNTEINLSSKSETDMQLKANRSYRSRSMLKPILDTRKRRFLFKSDSS
uniref:Chitin-binding type-2 domain-containing protein n=1 Tax=Glossina brevipalpis TaxID=37001 RepID=A0A1A9WLH0_9MUSC